MAIRVKDFQSAIPTEYRHLFEGPGVPDSLQYAMVKGRTLASTLNRLIDDRVTDDRSRSDIISAMGSAAGIDAGTVNEILNGSIDCPPLDRLSGFARVLGSTLSALRSAAEEDGCQYGQGNAASCEVLAKAGDADRSVRFIASDDSVDLDDEIITAGAFSRTIRSFMANPVLLASHRHSTQTGASAVIGSVRDIQAGSNPVVGKAVFGANAAGEDHWKLYRDGHQRAFSVGFRVLDSEVKASRVHITDALLLEISAVAVPANPHALVMEFISGRMVGFADQLERRNDGGAQLDEIRHAIEELNRDVGYHRRVLGGEARSKDGEENQTLGDDGGDDDVCDADYAEMLSAMGSELAASAPS